MNVICLLKGCGFTLDEVFLAHKEERGNRCSRCGKEDKNTTPEALRLRAELDKLVEEEE